MGLFNINKEMLSILEAFKREADKRIDRLENINAKSIEAYKGMKAYCEKTKKCGLTCPLSSYKTQHYFKFASRAKDSVNGTQHKQLHRSTGIFVLLHSK